MHVHILSSEIALYSLGRFAPVQGDGESWNREEQRIEEQRKLFHKDTRSLQGHKWAPQIRKDHDPDVLSHPQFSSQPSWDQTPLHFCRELPLIRAGDANQSGADPFSILSV